MSRVALVACTAADARDTIVEGESGFLATASASFRPEYEPSKRRLTWPNGAIATTYSAEEPDRLRGPQHDGFLADELAAWKYPETWTMLMMGLRLGTRPRGIVPTTPRPTPLVKQLAAADTTHLTTGTTYDNRSNLPASFYAQIIRQYEGTRLGRQELLAEILNDNPGALWKRARLDELRVKKIPPDVRLTKVVVAVDPAVTSNPDSDETGIVVVALGSDEHGYVLDDRSGKYTPAEWAHEVVAAYRKWEADRVIAEVNNGGDLVERNLRTVPGGALLPYEDVRASRGKQTRAEPVSGLDEQGRVHHVGSFPQLEDQLCDWDPTTGQKSPDRLDARVWGLTHLMLEHVDQPRGMGQKRLGFW